MATDAVLGIIRLGCAFDLLNQLSAFFVSNVFFEVKYSVRFWLDQYSGIV